MCSPIKLSFLKLFCKRKPHFDALSNVYQLTFGLSDVDRSVETLGLLYANGVAGDDA